MSAGSDLPEDVLVRALRGMAHRGPDDEGWSIQGRAALGQRRLSIIDTSAAGHQPLVDLGGRYSIVFNGEAFNYRELRAELEAQGHRFHSHTDTEVALRLYILKGEAFLDDLNGFFGLAIHDREKDELFVARDRFGVKPVWWCEAGGRFHFASELRALFSLGAPHAVDRHSLLQYFTYHFVPAPHAIVSGVQKLRPGHCLRVTATGVKERAWYDVARSAAATPAAPDPVARVRELMDDAVRARLVSDVPVGTFLSGGLDSSIVSALARRHKQDLHTFSIGYADDPFFDESDHAEEVARHIGSHHHTFRLTREELAENYVRLLDATDEPFADSSALPSYMLCERTRKHVTVALSGDGSDEVFGGYSKHQAELRLRAPGAAERAVIALAPLWRTMPRSRNNRLANTFRKLDRFAGIAHAPEEHRWLKLASFDQEGDAERLVPHAASAQEIDRRARSMAEGLQRMNGLNGVLLADVLTTLPNDMLHKVDLTSMAHSLEVRTPFLDRRVVEFAFSLPAERRFRKGSGKYLLREAFGELLPPSILARSKKGFEVPLLAMMRGPVAGLLDDLCRSDLVEAAGLDPSAVTAVLARLRSDRPDGAQATAHALAVYLSWWKTHGQPAPSAA